MRTTGWDVQDLRIRFPYVAQERHCMRTRRPGKAAADFVHRYSRAIAAGLSAIGFGSLLVVPFTEQYARESVPRQFWSSPQFKPINRHLTTMWALVFAAMVPAHVIAGALEPTART